MGDKIESRRRLQAAQYPLFFIMGDGDHRNQRSMSCKLPDLVFHLVDNRLWGLGERLVIDG